ncbi:unnamed protein product [Trichobilharzia szidati]|nr:unnamed protein product [Trichobilharzia szidati]
MSKQIVFLHPDLGIGGAERLIVDSAVALESCGYDITIITNHHDPNHCFEETQRSSLNVTVVGDWFPRSIFGYMMALCAYIRILIATIYLIVFYEKKADITFVDQISAPVILLRACGYRTIFYCHFPDMLLTKKDSFLKKLYRMPIDYIEQVSTGMADVVLVNSKFTSSVFKETFTSLDNVHPRILYPIANAKSLRLPVIAKSKDNLPAKYEYRKMLPAAAGEAEIIPEKAKVVFLSINRYERKKNLSLALYSLEYLFTHWDQLIDPSVELKRESIHLIIAGGYDYRVVENVEHYKELVNLAEALKISNHVTFMCSCSSEIKPLLIASSDAVIYTPDKEHFGIVPIEAMLLSRAVIALNSGGPKETIVHEQTGYLCTVEPTDQLPEIMATYLAKFINDPQLADRMGEAGCKRVAEKFSSASFKQELQSIVSDLME